MWTLYHIIANIGNIVFYKIFLLHVTYNDIKVGYILYFTLLKLPHSTFITITIKICMTKWQSDEDNFCANSISVSEHFRVLITHDCVASNRFSLFGPKHSAMQIKTFLGLGQPWKCHILKFKIKIILRDMKNISEDGYIPKNFFRVFCFILQFLNIYLIKPLVLYVLRVAVIGESCLAHTQPWQCIYCLR